MNINVVPATGYLSQPGLSSDDIEIIPLTQSEQMEIAIDGHCGSEAEALTYSVIEVDITKINLTGPSKTAAIKCNDATSRSDYHYRDTNIMVVLNVSFSSGHAGDGTTSFQSRMNRAKAVLANLLHPYGTLGDVRVTVVTSNENPAVQFAWGSVAAAIASLDTLAFEGRAIDAEAQNVVQAAWTADGKLAGDTDDVIYFLSDDKPTIGGGSGNQLNDAQTTAWNELLGHLQIWIDHVYAVGIGDDTNSPAQQKVTATTEGYLIPAITRAARSNTA